MSAYDDMRAEVADLRARIEAGIASAVCVTCRGDGRMERGFSTCRACSGSGKDNRVVSALRGEDVRRG